MYDRYEQGPITRDPDLVPGEIQHIRIRYRDISGRDVGLDADITPEYGNHLIREHNAITAAEMREAEREEKRKRKPVRLGIDEGPSHNGSSGGRLTGSALAREMLSRPGSGRW